MSLKDLKEKREDYVILFKNNDKSVFYIRLILFAFQSFCEANKLDHIKRIRKMLGKKQKPKKQEPSQQKKLESEIRKAINTGVGLFHRILT